MRHYAPDFCTKKAQSDQWAGFGAKVLVYAPKSFLLMLQLPPYGSFDTAIFSGLHKWMLKRKILQNETGIRRPLDQARLDISARSRTSRLPWRGQFSPEFIEYLMDEICPSSDVLYDPFCGSGTVLFEAVQRSKLAFGTEVNPAAWHLAVLSSFSTLDSTAQAEIIFGLRQLANASSSSGTLFAEAHQPGIFSRLHDDSAHPFFRLAMAAVFLTAMGNGTELSHEALGRSASSIISILKEIASTKGQASCFLADARQCPLASATVDAVITSPPYINVFNYHQNYRFAAEQLGWKPLEAASSEIGANRKHRQNRFLTVVQYCLDMSACIAETARLMKPGSPFVIVLGRTSNVLGASFRNGDIISEVIQSTKAFGSLEKAERSFINRFGERIYEDIIIASRNDETAIIDDNKLRDIGVGALEEAKEHVPAKNESALLDAIDKAGKVQASPLLSIMIPNIFVGKAAQRV